MNASIAIPHPSPSADHPAVAPTPRRWRPRSIVLIVLAWLVLHIGCLFTPGLLDDVDSVYLEIAREMLLRHDYVTPYIDGVRFFDKPPLMYWLASGSMYVFGPSAWAGRLPLALLTLALLLATYALALRLFRSDRAALYSALALATCIGPYLYTRFYIPDVPVALFLTVAIHAFLTALDRTSSGQPPSGAPFIAQSHRAMSGKEKSPSALIPCLLFSTATALNVLSKGLIGLVFPLGFAFFYLALTRQLRLLPKFHLIPSTLSFLAIAAPWHILAALRNPPIAMPSGLGLPPRAGWAWFYLYNEHIARFLSRRIPHDYGQVPIPLFWLLAAIWIFPWVGFTLAYIPSAVRTALRSLRPSTNNEQRTTDNASTAALTLLLWAALVLGFFTLSARQEYYSLPCLPALALMAGGLLASADKSPGAPFMRDDHGAHEWDATRSALLWHKWLLVPIGSLAAAIALFFAITAPHVDPRTDIAALLTQSGEYDLSLGHLFDLTGRAMGLFRIPLICFGLSMAAIGPGTYLLRRRAHTYAANLALAAAAACLLLCMHAGLVRFYPTLGSKPLADAILTAQQSEPQLFIQGSTAETEQEILPSSRAKPQSGEVEAPPHFSFMNTDAPFIRDPRDPAHGWNAHPDLILIDGELTSGSTLLFYTRQPMHLVNGRINGPWFGSFFPDSPHVFDTDSTLRAQWAGHQRVFLLTYHADQRIPDLARFAPVHTLASSGGKTILTNR